MENADGGDIMGKVEKHQKMRTKFTEKEIWHMFVQMLKGMKALHERKIYHRDLKSANMFMTKAGVLKIGDLNVSKVAKCALVHTQTGTPYYASPEVWKDKPYDSRSDTWSLGCVLYEMITLYPPFRAADMEGLSRKVIRGVFTPIPSTFSKDLATVVKKMLTVETRLRPTCSELLNLSEVQRNSGSISLDVPVSQD
jgi:NIMA (never in mitosis gene a)-related kinase